MQAYWMEPNAKPVVDLTTQCACGAVRVSFSGRVRAQFMCACEDCQRASGAGHSAVIMARPADVTITGPTRAFGRPANSGATFTRWFCPECGTPIYGQSSRAPDAILLSVGLFGRDAAWFAPTQLIFARSHRDWDVVAADLPQYLTYRGEGA